MHQLCRGVMVENGKEQMSRMTAVKHKKYNSIFDAASNAVVLLFSVVLFILFSCGFDMSVLEEKINFNRFFTVDSYKTVLNSSCNIIDSVYDSGSEENFFTYLREIINNFTGLDFKDPTEIFSARIPAFKVEPYIDDYGKVNNQNKKQNNGHDKKQNYEQNIVDNNDKKEKNQKDKTKRTNKNKDDNNILDESKQKNNTYKKGDIRYTNLANVKFDINELLTGSLCFNTDIRKKEILIYHTHTSEDYKDYGDFGVLQAGRYLKKYLEKEGVKVIHNAIQHDKDFNNSYNSSFNSINSIMKGNKDINVIIDLHRDAIGNGKLKVVNEYRGRQYAQLMFVVGTDKTLDNPNWKENLKLAVQLYDEMNRICPGIMRPLYLTTRRYNQHLSNGSLLIEVGADGNSIDECENSMKIFAKALKKVLY